MMQSRFWYWFAIGFGLGHSPVASGTVASLATVLLAYVWWSVFPLSFSLIVISVVIGVVLTLLGIPASAAASQRLVTEDPKQVVIDEIAAQWLVCIAAPAYALYTNSTDVFSWEMALVAFLLFRVFDILKPGPIGWCDRELPGGLGIMLDDTLAAVASILCLGVFFLLPAF